MFNRKSKSNTTSDKDIANQILEQSLNKIAKSREKREKLADENKNAINEGLKRIRDK